MPRGSYLHADPLTGEPAWAESFECAAWPAGWRYVSTVRSVGGGGDGARRIDVTLDSTGRQVRVELAAAGWLLRGGVAGRETVWVRSPAPPEAPEAGAAPETRQIPAAPATRAVGSAGPGGPAGPVQPVQPVGPVGSGGGVGAGGLAEAGAAGSGGPVELTELAAGFTGGSPVFLLATARLLRHAGSAEVGQRRAIRMVEVAGPALAARVVEQAWTLAGTDRHDTDVGPLVVRTWQVDDLEAGTRREVHLAGDVLLAAPGVELAELREPPTPES